MSGTKQDFKELADYRLSVMREDSQEITALRAKITDLESTVAGLREAIAEMKAENYIGSDGWFVIMGGSGHPAHFRKSQYPKFVAVALRYPSSEPEVGK